MKLKFRFNRFRNVLTQVGVVLLAAGIVNSFWRVYDPGQAIGMAALGCVFVILTLYEVKK